jgi:predicted helicase
MPGPYAVAHLRIGQRIAEISGKLSPEVRVYLTDTLDDPASAPETIPLWGDADVLAEERRRAQSVKRDENIMVAIGNPPYRRLKKSSGEGGWVVPSGKGRSLFDDILEPANAVTIFSHIASLYNLYVYFWRWAIWKVFEAQGDGPAVVSFITASSWLTGPGFVGLRQLAQSIGDEIWVCDLGGDNCGTHIEENEAYAKRSLKKWSARTASNAVA